jgi:tight adherence protein B
MQGMEWVAAAVAVFLAVVLGAEGLWLLWQSRHGPSARRLAQRLALVSAPAAAMPTSSTPWLSRPDGTDPHGHTPPRAWLPALQSALEGWRIGRRLQRWVETAGTRRAASDLALLGIGAGMVASAVAWAVGFGAAAAGAGAAMAAAAPWMIVARQRRGRTLRIERQFPQALDLLGRALRAGHAFTAAVRMAAEELPDPLVREFRLLFEEMNYGVAVPEALARFAARVPLADAGYFAVAVTIQREAGGNLAEVLDKIAWLVRERLRLRGEVRTLSAEGRLSAVILTALPFAVAGVVQLVNPGFLAVLWTDPAGTQIVGFALAGIVVGVLWMRSVIRIRI